MKKVIDFNTQIFPPFMSRLPVAIQPWAARTREMGKFWLRQVANPLHEIHTRLRWLPPNVRNWVEPVSRLGKAPGLILDSGADDLAQALSWAGADHAVISVPPTWAPREGGDEFLRKAAEDHPALIPAVTLPFGNPNAAHRLRAEHAAGVRLARINAHLPASVPTRLLTTARELGTLLLFDGPAETLEGWLKRDPEATYVFLTMNGHDPELAWDLAERYPGLWLETSRQPAEAVGEAVRRLGAERLLFGSDWPMIGNNINVGMERIRDCVSSAMITDEDSEKILGGNAAQLLERHGITV